MAKTIKFNLLLDNKPIRTIEELQENFCIDDVLELYENGILQRCLGLLSETCHSGFGLLWTSL